MNAIGARDAMNPEGRLFGSTVSLWLMLLPALLLTGCSFGSGTTRPVMHEYQLVVAPAGPALPGVPACGVLEIAMPLAAPGFGSTAMRYTRQPYRLERFASHEWTDTPARMLHAALLRRFSASGLFAGVVPAPAGVPVLMRLEIGDWQVLQQFQGADSTLLAAFQARFFEPLSRTLLGVSNAREEVAAGTGPVSGVAAANEVLAVLLERLVAEAGRLRPDCGNAS